MAKKLSTKHKKEELKVKVERYDLSTVDDWIAKFQEIKDKIPANAENIYQHIEIGYDCGYYDSIEPYVDVHIAYWLPLTKEEILTAAKLKRETARLAKESKAQQQREIEAKERHLLEELKKKYESN